MIQAKHFTFGILCIFVLSVFSLLNNSQFYEKYEGDNYGEDLPTRKNAMHKRNFNKNLTVSCKPRKFVYPKTHKTASTSILKTLKKFAWRVGFKNVVQFPYPYIGGYPGVIQPKFVFYKSDSNIVQHSDRLKRPDVIMGHFRYNKESVEEVLQHKFRTITILRDPLEQFQSAFNYYYKKFKSRRKVHYTASCFSSPYFDVLGGFQLNISTFITMLDNFTNFHDLPWNFRSSNSQSFDLGADTTRIIGNQINNEIQKISKQFDLVMISEYFLESLILLKEELCLDWSDIDLLPHNINKMTKQQLTEDEKVKVQKLNILDFALYKHFNETFWIKVQQYGKEKMEKSKQHLISLQKFTRPKRHMEPEYQTKNLKERIALRNQQNNFNISNDFQVDITEYMTKNGGGCLH